MRGRWTGDTAYPEWTCSNYAPIPGRETRDMGRADYQALDRTTRIIAYGTSWLERQDNVKTIHRDGGRVPLGQRDGQELVCAVAGCRVRAPPRPSRARARRSGPSLRETWDGVLTGRTPFVETVPPGQPPRFVKMYEVEHDYLGRDLADPVDPSARRASASSKVIEAYRDPAAAGR